MTSPATPAATAAVSTPGLLDRAGFWLSAACLGLTQFNLLAAQALFGLAAILWLVATLRSPRDRPPLPRWMVPLTIYAALTILSALWSLDRVASLIDCKQLVLFLVVPVIARFARGERAHSAMAVLVLLALLNGAGGVADYLFVVRDPDHRPTGLLSHHMTYSGVLMLLSSVAAAQLLFARRGRVVGGAALTALLVAIAVANTRSAWLGVVGALTALLVMRKALLLLFVPALVAVFLVAAPPKIRERAYSIVDPRYQTNLGRIVLLKMGRDIIRDHPWFGVGPDQIRAVQASYRENYEAVNELEFPHLHNVPVQIAAERGLPALGAWLWFAAALFVDLVRRLRAGPAPAVAAAGLGAAIAMMVAGLFEYNFGDSEFLMLFLGLVTLPHAAASGLQSLAPDRPDRGDPQASAPDHGARP